MEKKSLSPFLLALDIFAFAFLFRSGNNDRMIVLQLILAILGSVSFYRTFDIMVSKLNAIFKGNEYRSKQIKDCITENTKLTLQKLDIIIEEFDYVEKITEDFSKQSNEFMKSFDDKVDELIKAFDDKTAELIRSVDYVPEKIIAENNDILHAISQLNDKLEIIDGNLCGNMGSVIEHTIKVSDNIRPLAERLAEISEETACGNSDILDDIARGVNAVDAGISNTADELSSTIEDNFSRLSDSLSVLEEKVEFAYDRINNSTNESILSIKDLFDDYISASENLRDDIYRNLEEIIRRSDENVSEIVSKQAYFTDFAETTATDFKTELIDILEKTSSDIEAFNDECGEVISSLSAKATAIADSTEDFTNVCRESMEMLSASLSDTVSQSLAGVTEMSEKSLNGINELVSTQTEFTERVSESVNNLETICEDNLININNDMSDYISDLKSEISDLRDAVSENITTLTENQNEFSQNLTGIIEDAVNSFNDAN